jgi:mRNA interferase MazF
MTDYNAGDIILVPFPLGDQFTPKKRPAAIIFVETDQVTMAQITGNITRSPRKGDYLIANWQECGLLRPSLVRRRFATIPISAVLRKIGNLGKEEFDKTLTKLLRQQ